MLALVPFKVQQKWGAARLRAAGLHRQRLLLGSLLGNDGKELLVRHFANRELDRPALRAGGFCLPRRVKALECRPPDPPATVRSNGEERCLCQEAWKRRVTNMK